VPSERIDFASWTTRAEDELFVIAEAGVNHNGDVALAKQLVDVAKDAGCDAVKFQTWVTERVYSRSLSQKPPYQQATTSHEDSEFDTIKKLELSFDDFRALKRYCDERGILFFSTPDDAECADFLIDIGVPLMKSASQDVTNLPLLRHLAKGGVPLIYSTGGCTLDELVAGAETIRAETSELVVLHCVSSYPAPLEQMNLNVIPMLRAALGCPVGLSDHTVGVEAACAAVALGARFFEKHITLSRTLPGPDHQASIEPGELAAYVRSLRALRRGLGDGRKRILPVEEQNRAAFRRYLVTARAIPRGTALAPGDLVAKKVVSGLAPDLIEHVVGAVAVEDIPADVPLQWRHLKFP
jgi:N,N'-diacetyllegionaminate synthase